MGEMEKSWQAASVYTQISIDSKADSVRDASKFAVAGVAGDEAEESRVAKKTISAKMIAGTRKKDYFVLVTTALGDAQTRSTGCDNTRIWVLLINQNHF